MDYNIETTKCPKCGKVNLRIGNFGETDVYDEFRVICDSCDFCSETKSSDYGEVFWDFIEHEYHKVSGKVFDMPRNPYGDCDIYKKSQISINPGLTVLVGCNGSGKTTFLKLIEEKLIKNKIPVISFDNRVEGGANSVSKAGFEEDFDLLARLVTCSEGEQIKENISLKAEEIGRFVKNNFLANEIWILLDAVDSGFSIDNVIELKGLFETILSDLSGKKKVYILVSANEYELCRGEQCFDVTNSKYVTFEKYDDYRDFILKNRKIKDNRKYKPIKRG